VVLRGGYACHAFVEMLCVKVQLPESEGGFNSPVIFIDGGNIFDPYLIADYSRQCRLGIGDILRGIKVSRAFTSYQLATLIKERLPSALKKYKSKVVIIAEILRLFQTSDMDEEEARRVFNELTVFLSNLAKKEGILVVATCLHCRPSRRRSMLEPYLVSRADMCGTVLEGKTQEYHELSEYG